MKESQISKIYRLKIETRHPRPTEMSEIKTNTEMYVFFMNKNRVIKITPTKKRLQRYAIGLETKVTSNIG